MNRPAVLAAAVVALVAVAGVADAATGGVGTVNWLLLAVLLVAGPAAVAVRTRRRP